MNASENMQHAVVFYTTKFFYIRIHITQVRIEIGQLNSPWKLILVAVNNREEESQNNEGNSKEKKKVRTKSRGTELMERRMWREKTTLASVDGNKQPRVTLPSNKEPTFYIGGGNGVAM